MTEKDLGANSDESHKVIISGGECLFHPGENFACVKVKGPFSEQGAKASADTLKQILPELSGQITVTPNGHGTMAIPEMCQDCEFWLPSPKGIPPETQNNE